jgi:metal-responsive CopG/Arc/MetJ family transcriptional regulator
MHMPRTTIELPARELAELRSLAARRGTRGFSGIVADALREYFRRLDERTEEEALRRFRSARGALKDKEAEHLREHVQRLRSERW